MYAMAVPNSKLIVLNAVIITGLKNRYGMQKLIIAGLNLL